MEYKTFSNAKEILSTSCGSKYKAPNPATSGREDVLLQATGHSYKKLSKIGNPNPS